MSITYTQTNSTQRRWITVGMSSDGQYQTATESGRIYRSIDYGLNWTQTGTFSCGFIKVSSSGQYQTIADNTDIYYSSDYGATWNSVPLPNFIQGLTMSLDGSKQSAILDPDVIYYSTNYGASWTASDAPSTSWKYIAASSNGLKQTAINFGNTLYSSTNGGQNWTSIVSQPSNVWNGIAMSADGTNQSLISTNSGGDGFIYLFDGTIFTPSDAHSRNWLNIVMSSSGQYQVASNDTDPSNYAYISSNYGVNWTPISDIPNSFVRSLQMSSSGQYIAITCQNRIVYNSIDFGVTWTQNTQFPLVNSYVFMSSSGSVQTVIYNDFAPPRSPLIGYLWRYVNENPPCFNEGTKILCLVDNKEVYKPIEILKEDDLVKTYLHGYRKVKGIGKNVFVNDPTKPNNCMFVLKKQQLNNNTIMIDDLIVTGDHSILVDHLPPHYSSNVKINDKYLMPARHSKIFEKRMDTNMYTYYHFYLENDGDEERRYGVWANGVLAETTFERDFKKKNYMKMIES